ncbi:MAG: sodium/solute symporter [Pseudomonadota bacterium]
MQGSFGLLNWLIVGAYLVGNLYLGWRMSRRVTTAEDYYLGDRSTPWWAIGISVVATYVSALSFLGGPAWAYGDGMAALIIHVNYPLVIFIVIAIFLPFFFNSGVASIYDYLERRFGPASRTVMSVLFLITQSITTASILTATAIVVTFVTGIDPRWAVLIMTAIVLVYTLMGGMNAVIWTDVMQGVILFIGAGLVLYFLLDAVSPLSGAFETLAADEKLNPLNFDLDITVAPTVWAGIVAMTLFHITVYGGNQMMVQRALAAKNIGDAKKSYLMMGYGAFFIYFLFFFVGALLYVHFEGRPFDQSNEIILRFADSLAFPGLMGILAAAVLSASMSTLSSALNSLATVSVTDLWAPFVRAKERQNRVMIGLSLFGIAVLLISAVVMINGAEDPFGPQSWPLWSWMGLMLLGASVILIYSMRSIFSVPFVELSLSRALTALWALLVIPMAFAFISSGGSILEALSRAGSYFVGAKLALFGMGFFSKHVSERGLLIGVAAGFIGMIAFVGFGGLFGVGGLFPDVAWPWYVAIGGLVNIVVAWVASVMLDGFQSEWHPQTVPGQIKAFRDSGRAEKVGGWFVVPGRVDKAAWGLPIMFIAIMGFLAWFGTLG